MYNGTPTDASLIVYATCGPKPTGYNIASNSASVSSGFTLEDGIACPAGTSALDGGARTMGHSPLVLAGGSIDQGARRRPVSVTVGSPLGSPESR